MRKYLLINIVLIALLGTEAYYYHGEATMTYQRLEQTTVELTAWKNDSTVRIERAKDKIVDSLAKDCETKDVKEPDAAIILDSNNQMSIGAWMWQIKSVQFYVKKFEGRDIDRVEAIRIAIDHDKAHELTKKVLFEEKDGWTNWLMCGKKLNLANSISIINNL